VLENPGSKNQQFQNLNPDRRLLTKPNTCTAKLLFCHDLNTSIHPLKCAFKGYVIANQEMDILCLIPLCYVLANVAAIILLLPPVEMLL
jgi:hypothetical protein